jgi:hypothetical protein
MFAAQNAFYECLQFAHDSDAQLLAGFVLSEPQQAVPNVAPVDLEQIGWPVRCAKSIASCTV